MSGEDPISSAMRQFVAAEVGVELPLVKEGDNQSVALAGLGTMAPKALNGALLPAMLQSVGVTIGARMPFEDIDQLFEDPEWQVALLLSPWKRSAAAWCDELAPTATETAVVDTIVRGPDGATGYNTNVWAARTALEVLAGGAAPTSVLAVGAGASAHSAALAARRLWPTCRILITARSADGAAALASHVGGTPVESFVHPVDLIVHATAWGETADSEAQPFPLDLSPWLRPAIGFFDLNNRIGALQHQALDAGCRVMSGALMQRVTHACRAALTSLALREVLR